MIENLPQYVGPVFILTTFLTAGFLIYAVRTSAADSLSGKVVLFILAFWLMFQAILGTGGFFQNTEAMPPRIFAFGALPALAFIVLIFVFARTRFVDRLPLKVLTLLHIVRIPVELVLLWLFQGGIIPESMTFEGRNFDILSGITAPIVYLLAFRGGTVNRPLLIIWNVLALLLLVNVVATAVLSFPGPIQQLSFDQPNRAIMYFPYNWLPSVIVPVVLFAHLAAFRQLLSKSTN